jgi:hypothetical protein
MTRITASDRINTLATETEAAISDVMAAGDLTERDLAQRQQRINEELFQRIHQLIAKDAQ